MTVDPLRDQLAAPPSIRCAYCRGSHATMTALEACAAVVLARQDDEARRDREIYEWLLERGRIFQEGCR